MQSTHRPVPHSKDGRPWCAQIRRELRKIGVKTTIEPTTLAHYEQMWDEHINKKPNTRCTSKAHADLAEDKPLVAQLKSLEPARILFTSSRPPSPPVSADGEPDALKELSDNHDVLELTVCTVEAELTSRGSILCYETHRMLPPDDAMVVGEKRNGPEAS